MPSCGSTSRNHWMAVCSMFFGQPSGDRNGRGTRGWFQGSARNTSHSPIPLEQGARHVPRVPWVVPITCPCLSEAPPADERRASEFTCALGQPNCCPHRQCPRQG